jgi:hypothetical protein
MTNDNRIKFLIENNWDWNSAIHKGSHAVLTDGEFVGIDEAMDLQGRYDPESVRDMELVENLSARYAGMYDEHMES